MGPGPKPALCQIGVKFDRQRPCPLSLALLDRLFPFWALPFSPDWGKSIKRSALGKTGNLAVLPKPLTLGEVALRSNDGEGKAADNQIFPRSDTELVSATAPYCYTEPVKSHSSQNLEKLPVFCRNLSLKWQL